MMKRLLIACIVFFGGPLTLLFAPAHAQGTPEDLLHHPADYNLVNQYLDKYGYKEHTLTEAGGQKFITFRVQDSNKNLFDFSILLLPKEKIIKFECHNLRKVPSDSAKLNALVKRLTELNGKRTIGKYCLTPNGKNKVRYFYYMSVEGGLCFADFRKTLGMMEYILTNDIKAIMEPL